MAADSAQADTRRVALFPLSVVLFPGGLLPLRIFEPRYQRMVSECLRHDQPFAVAAIMDGPEAGGIAMTAPTGTLASIVDWEQLEDGLLGVLCEGRERFILGRSDAEPDGLLRADVQVVAAREPRPVPGHLEWMAALLAELLQRLGPPYDRLQLPEPSAEHVGARLIELLPLPLSEKQALFDIRDDLERLQRLAGLINPGAAQT